MQSKLSRIVSQNRRKSSESQSKNGVAFLLHRRSRPRPNAVLLGISEYSNPLKTQHAVENHVDYETVALTT